ncbi:MAG: aspartate aminotransferase family protein [Armatimonadetes bacterium]|nr:aspartate aminotransferase family protein [Armatimonadota bacterium]
MIPLGPPGARPRVGHNRSVEIEGADALLAEVTEKYSEFLNPGLARLLSFAGFGVEARAEGCYVFDHSGRKFLDCLGGYGVFSLGHRHPKVLEAARAALDTMPLSAKVFFSKPMADLAEKLAEITPGGLKFTFLCNSGTEAVEGALKVAKAFDGRPKVVSTEGGYHGKSMGSLSATGREKYRAPFYPLVPEFVHVPFNDVQAMEEAVDNRTAAVIVEPVQGEGGIHVPDISYLPSVREICDRNDALLVLDEVQTGFGRTGRMFGMEHSGVVPDLVTFAKALGGGVAPIGAFVGTREVWERTFGPNPLIHTSTFGGNAMACAAALAVIDVVTEERLWERSEKMGARLIGGLRNVRSQLPDLIADVRGLGLMIGVEFAMDDVAEICIGQMLKRGVVAAYTLNNSRVIRFEPPLIIEESQVDMAVNVFGEALDETQSLVSAVMGDVSG